MYIIYPTAYLTTYMVILAFKWLSSVQVMLLSLFLTLYWSRAKNSHVSSPTPSTLPSCSTLTLTLAFHRHGWFYSFYSARQGAPAGELGMYRRMDEQTLPS
jgi:hypothetical protein